MWNVVRLDSIRMRDATPFRGKLFCDYMICSSHAMYGIYTRYIERYGIGLPGSVYTQQWQQMNNKTPWTKTSSTTPTRYNKMKRAQFYFWRRLSVFFLGTTFLTIHVTQSTIFYLLFLCLGATSKLSSAILL